MPDFTSSPTADLLIDATRLFAGLTENDEIAADLAPFGYTPATARNGLAAVEALHAAMRAQAGEQTEADAADKASTAATAALRALFVVHRDRARRAHPAGSAGHAALDLAGDTPHAEARVFADARRFYQALQDAPDLARNVRNLPPATVTDALAALDTAEDAQDAQTREGGEAQRASALRRVAEDALRRLAAPLAADARDALSGKPQLREVLGLYEP